MRSLRFGRMSDDQRRAMFWKMNNRFAEGSDDPPKVTVSYTESTFGGGESDSSSSSSGGDSGGGGSGGPNDIPESVASAFDMFDTTISEGSNASSSQDSTTDQSYTTTDSGSETTFTAGDVPPVVDIDRIELGPEIPEVTSYETKTRKGINVDMEHTEGYMPFDQNQVLESVPTASSIEQTVSGGIKQSASDATVIQPEIQTVEIGGGEVPTEVPEIPEISRVDSLNAVKTNLEKNLSNLETELTKLDISQFESGDEYQKRISGLVNQIEATKRSISSVNDSLKDLKYEKDQYGNLTLSSEFKKGFDEALKSEVSSLGKTVTPVNIARSAAHQIERVGEFGAGVVKSAGRTARMVAVPAAEAFGTTAGVGVTEAIRGVKDIMELPQQEFHIPPGYQKIWTGSEYVVRPQARYPMEPWAVSKAMGVGMPPGVDVRVQGQSAVPVRDVGRFFGPSAVVSPERGYGGVDYLWGIRDLEPQGFKPLIDMPKIPTPDTKVPAWVTMPWVVPPAEVLYGGQQAKAVTRPAARAISYGMGGYSPAPVRRQISPVESAVNYDYSSAKVKPTAAARIQSIPRFPTASSKPQVIKLPRTVSRVISESEGLSALPSGSAEYAKKEAKLQSGIDYAERHNLPGSMGRYAMEQYGLVS